MIAIATAITIMTVRMTTIMIVTIVKMTVGININNENWWRCWTVIFKIMKLVIYNKTLIIKRYTVKKIVIDTWAKNKVRRRKSNNEKKNRCFLEPFFPHGNFCTKLYGRENPVMAARTWNMDLPEHEIASVGSVGWMSVCGCVLWWRCGWRCGGVVVEMWCCSYAWEL